MIRSMTGYGRGESVMYSRKISVEIKSVNHRYNELAIKMPRIMNAYEDDVRKFLSGYITRGKTDVYVNIDTFSKDDAQICLNEALADAYVEKLLQIKERYMHTGIRDDISLSLLMRFPDVITAERNYSDEKAACEIYESVTAALVNAVAMFVKMREREGEALKKDICLKNDTILALLGKIKLRAPQVVSDYRERLTVKMNEILADNSIDESRILTEAAVFADKSCVDEEMTRLSSHLSQLPQILEMDGAIGKKLDFLVQEINREVNTIGSKSNDLEITRIIVDIKSEVEKIREQVQNIE